MAAFLWVEFFWIKYIHHQKRINSRLKCNVLHALYIAEASIILFTDFVADFAHFATVLMKQSMNLETADANTMLSTEE